VAWARAPGDADQAVSCLARAWREANRSSAEVVASIDVVDSLFADRWSPPDGFLHRCAPDPQGEGMACRYEYHRGEYRFIVRRSEGGWRVIQLQRSP